MNYPITMDSRTAAATLSESRTDGLASMVGTFAREILKKNPTLNEAQAVLVKTWDAVLLNARLGVPPAPAQKEAT